MGVGDPALDPAAELKHSVSNSSTSISSPRSSRSSTSVISASSSPSRWDWDSLRAGLSLVRAVRKPCLRRSLLTSSSSLLDPSLGTTTTPSSSASSSGPNGPSTVMAGKPIELGRGRFEIADSDLVDLCPSPPEVWRQSMVGSGIRTICSVSNVRASIKWSKDVCCKVPWQKNERLNHEQRSGRD